MELFMILSENPIYLVGQKSARHNFIIIINQKITKEENFT